MIMLPSRCALLAVVLAVGAPALALAPAGPRSFEAIKASGTLRIAIRERPGVARKTGPHAGDGFHFCLAEGFAKRHGLKLEVKWMPLAFKNYFTKDGVFDEAKIKKGPGYLPDVLREVDVATDGFAPLAWRKKLGRFVSVLLVKQMVLYHKTRMPEPKSVADLKGRTVYVRRGTAQEDLVSSLAREVPLTVKSYMEASDPAALATSDLQPLLDDKADFLLLASSYSIPDARGHAKVGFAFAIGPEEESNWMLAKDNRSLAEALADGLAKAREDGGFETCFKQEYGMSYNDYLKSLSLLDVVTR